MKNSLEGLTYLLQAPFRGINMEFESAKYVLLGFPFDGTTAHRPGARFGPQKLREASRAIESISLLTKLDTDKIALHDAGDIAIVHGDPNLSLKRLERAVSVILLANKKPIIIGGEHTATLGAIKALVKVRPELKDFLIISLDAHMDLYDEWPPHQKISHATVTRRLVELVGHDRVMLIGVRACSLEELNFVKTHNIKYITAYEILKNRENALQKLSKIILGKSLYLSLDLDVLDPSIMPAVGDPEAGGLNYMDLISLIREIIDYSGEITGFDIVELNPVIAPESPAPYIASRILLELLALDSLKRYSSTHSSPS